MLVSKTLFLFSVFLLSALPSQAPPKAQGDPFPGNPPVCPRWAFRPWVWEDNGNTQKSTLSLVRGYLERKIPVGAVIIDSPWETAYNSFVWDKKRYPRPEKMIALLHAKGVRVIMWITGAMNRTGTDAPQDKAPDFDRVLRKGWAVDGGREFTWWKGKGVHLDFTKREARRWFGSRMARIMKMGADGWKVDQAEDYLGKVVETSLGPMKKSLFKRYYYAALADLSLELNPESLIVARPFSHQGGFAAPVSKCAVGWGGDYGGDWKGLILQVQDLYKSARAGYGALCVEVGGFNGAKPSREQLVRYAQFGAMMPVMNNGGGNGGLTNHLPWFHGKETAAIYRYFATLHDELVPYLFSCSVDSHLHGGSIVKSPDPVGFQHLLGDRIFTSLVVSPGGRKHVTLPGKGRWIDYWNEDKLYSPGTEMDLKVPLDRFPIFLKAGAILPMDVRDGLTGHGDDSSSGKDTILVYPFGSSSLLYHRPRGEGVEYDDIRIRMNESRGTLSVRGGKKVSFRFRVKSFAEPSSVENADSWKYEDERRFIVIDKRGASFDIRIEGLKGYSRL